LSTNSGEILSKTSILEKLESNELVVTPLINEKDQLSSGSIDLRLNTEFITTKRTRFSLLDPLDDQPLEESIMEYQEKTFRKLGEGLTLHPSQFVLGSTLEYVKLPYDITAYVAGRSSLGRLGLVIATAPVIHPGFSGMITLELTNLGDAPIILYPGIRIAQLVFHKTENDIEDPPSKYQFSVGPQFSSIHKDKDLKLLKKLKDKK
jgi:dCTP deaminase